MECKECGRSFTEKGFSKHISAMHPHLKDTEKYSFKCAYCPQTFPCMNHLTRHTSNSCPTLKKNKLEACIENEAEEKESVNDLSTNSLDTKKLRKKKN